MPATAHTSETRIAEILADPRAREMRRDFTVDRSGIDKEARTVPLSFASEQAVDRWFGREILDITKDACDLSRLNNGGAVLVDHNWSDQVGVVLEASVDPSTKKARCIAKFSRSTRGNEIFQDILDGIRSLVSVGYIVRKMVLQSVEGDVETHRVTDWQPYEVSVVAVPADTSVGIGRSAKTQEAPAVAATPAPAASTRKKSNSMSETPATPETTPAVTQVNDFAAERQRIKDLNASAKVLADRHPDHADAFRALAAKCAETGDNLDAFNRTVINDILGTKQTLAPVRQDPNAATIGLSENDRKRYSILKAVREVIDNKPISGLERECSDELAKKLDRQPKGFFLPDEITVDRRNARTLLAGSPVDGGFLVGQDILASEFVTFLRNQARVIGLGARYISGLRGDVSIPRQLTGTSAYWVSETGSITASSSTFGQIVAKPRRIGTSVPYSKQFLAQTSLDADQFVVNDSDEAIAVELDRVAINGAGGAEPLGILNLPSAELAGTVTFSGAPTWAKYLEFFRLLATAKTLGLGNPSYLTTPNSAVKAMSTVKFANTASPIWEDDKIGVFPAAWTNQFPAADDKVILGAFSEVIYLEWAGRDVVVDPYSGKKEGTVEVTIQRLMDMVIRRAKSFVRSTDDGDQ